MAQFDTLGPLSASIMQELYEDGVLDDSTLVQRPGLTDWVAVHIVEASCSSKSQCPFVSAILKPLPAPKPVDYASIAAAEKKDFV